MNWQTERINGRNVVTLIALKESVTQSRQGAEADAFETVTTEQIRVLKLESQ